MLTTPLLVGLDGEQKMSKSLGNYVGIAEPPREQFGKLMSIPDALMPNYFQYATDWPPEQVAEVTRAAGVAASCTRTRPSGCWPGRSSTCTTATGAGEAAEAEFDRVFKEHAAPDDMPEKHGRRPRPAQAVEVAGRRSASRRRTGRPAALIEAGAVKIDGEPVAEDRELRRGRARRAGRPGREAEVGPDPLASPTCADGAV